MESSARRDAAFGAERQRQLRRRFRLRGPVARLLSAVELSEPAPVAEIAAAAAVLRVAFPRDYVDFLRATNGATGQVGRSFVELWPVHSLRERNERLDLEGALVAFGNGSPGEVFAFGAEGFLTLPRQIPRGRTLAEFLQALTGS